MADKIDDISFLLGEINAGVQRLTKEFDTERESAAKSRATIHERLDDQVRQISHLEGSVAIAGTVSAQTRDKVDAIEVRLDKEVAPTIEEWRKIKNMGLGMAALIGLGGATIASAIWVFVTYFWDGMAETIRNALRIH